MKKLFHIAIDGPAGSGKSTVAKEISKRLGILYLDSGALYRMIAYYFQGNGVDLADVLYIQSHLDEISIVYADGHYILNGEVISAQIRKPQSGASASAVSRIGQVREKVNFVIRGISEKCSMVVDGRDIGTVVLKDARYKFFLTASSQERAERRYKELIAKNENVSFEDVLNEINQRDRADSSRSIAPLKPAPDAVIIDTTGMAVEQVCDIIAGYIDSGDIRG